MVKSIYVPEAGGVVNFPDDTSPQTMRAYIDAKYPRAAAPAAAPTPDESTVSQRLAYGLMRGITDIPGGIASLMYPEAEAAQTAAGRWSAGNRAYLQKQLNIDPTKEPSTAQYLAETLGSAASFLVPGTAVAKGAKLLGTGAKLAAGLGTGTATAQGIALGAGSRADQIRQQLESGMEISEEDQLAAQRLSGLIGASEAIPMAKFFGPLTTILSKVPASKAAIVQKIVSNRLAKVTRAGVEEAAQEVASGIANDLMEYGVYNPDVQIGQDLLSNAAGGAFAGSTLEGIIQLAAGRKLRGARQLQKDLDAEKQTNAAELRQAYIAQDADNLLASGVRGEVSIAEEEDPAGFTKFVLKDTVGTPIAEYESLDTARKVIDLYKQKSGIDVSVREPGVEPTPPPGPAVPTAPKVELKVGNRKFASVDDILAEKKKHTDEIAKINVFKNNPELLVKEAKAQGVAPGVYAKDLDIKIAKNQAQVSKYDQYINSLQQPPAEPVKAPSQPIKAAGPLVTPKTAITPEAVAVPEVATQPAVEAIRAKEQEIKADTLTEVEAPEQAAPEAIEPAAIEPEMPIGAVEMPIEESRVLPDEIVDSETKPIPVGVEEEAPTQTVKRPSATDAQLTALKVEMFGEPLGYRQMTPEQLAAYEAERDKRFPPQDVNVPLSAGITGQTAPRNMREAVISGPVVKDYSPETQEWMSKVYTGLMNRLTPIVPTEATVNLQTLIDQGPGYLVRGQARPEQTPDGMKTVIDLSTGILKPGMSVEDAINTLADTMNHEIIHVLRDKGVIRPSEWNILSRAATNTNVPGKKYTYLDKAQAIYAPIGPNGEPIPMAEIYANPDAVVEEAVAEMYRNWVKDREKPPQPVVGLFNRITEFFRRIFQTLRNARHQDVFEAIQRGEVGSREGEGRERASMFSAAPVEIMAGYQDENGVHVRPFPEDATTSSTAYLRQEFKRFKGKGRYLDEQWGRALDEAFLNKFGRTYDINDPADYQQIVRSIADEVRLQMQQAQSGVGWYDSDIQDVFDELAKSFPILKDPADGPAMRQMFTVIAGVMSNGMKAKANVELAAINFAHFLRTGSFSPIHPFTNTGWNQRSNIMGPQIAMLNRMINDPMFAPRQGSNNPRIERFEKFLRFMFTEHSVREINAFRARHGTRSPAKIGKFDDRRLGMYAFGPKFGPFILNLNGLSDETVDSWASRSFYRHMGRSIGPDGQLYKAPLTSNREAMKRALRDVGAQTNLSSRDIQAVLWFYEKELYNQLGQSNPLEVFSDGAREFTRKYGPRTAGPSQPRTGREGEISRSIKAAGTRTGQSIPRGPRFSAAPLPPYVEQQNASLFAPTPQISYRDMMFDWFFGHRNTGKTLQTMNGTVDISKGTMAALSAKSAVVDKNAYLTHLESLLNEQRTGNFQRMQADYSATAALAWRRRSGHLTASMMLRGKLDINFDRPGDIQSATMKVTDDPDNLKEIFKVMTEPGPDKADGTPTTKADIFKSYAVALRGEWLRSTGQNVPAAITPQYIRETVDFTRREYPEVVEAYNKYQRFNKNLLTAAKDAGIISQAELGRLTNQMNYYGFIYEAYGEPLGPSSSQKTASKFKLRPYTGTQYGGLSNDPMFVMIQNAQFWVDSIAKNLAATKAYNVAKLMGEARPLRSDESPNEMAGEAKDVMYYSEGGVVKKFAVKDPLLVAALGSDDRIDVGKFWQVLGVPAHVLRESVTRDPAFMARNLMRDTVAAWMNSGVDFVPVIDTIKGFTTALKGGASFEALSARGVVGSYDLAMMGPQEIADTFRRNAMPLNVHTVASVEGGTAAIRSLWNRLGTISEASDAATRIAVYDALKAQGMTDAEAAMQAIELLDFTRRGGSQTLGILTKLIPFLNARIQGMDVLYQAGRSGIRTATGGNRGERDANLGKKFLVRGGMLAALSVALEMLNDDDEDYKQLDNYIKEGNLLIPLKEFGLEGQFLAIPKPFENGLLFSTIPQQIYKTMSGDASVRDNVNLFFGQMSSTFGVNPIPQALLPPIEMITNHNFYTGLPLISEGKQRLAPELQYNTSTSQIAMLLGGLPIYYDFTTGRFGGMSPIMIDKLISGYGGPIGTYLVQGTSLAMQDFQIGPERMPMELSNAPVIRSFFVDAKSKNPKVVTQAYELFRVADEANRTYSRLKQMGDAEALIEYVDANRDILSYKKYIFSLTDRLNKLSAQERAIERDSSMTAEEKIEAQRRLRDIRIRLSAQVFEINKKLGR